MLLFPYPHGHTVEPMAQGPIADILVGMGRQVVTFDVPGAYQSTREPTGKMEEIIRAADEVLDALGIQAPVDVVGHSMGGFTALAYAIERPERDQVDGAPDQVDVEHVGDEVLGERLVDERLWLCLNYEKRNGKHEQAEKKSCARASYENEY